MPSPRRPLLQLLSLSALGSLALSGCMVGPDFKPLPAPSSTHYTRASLPKRTQNTASAGNPGKAQYFAQGRDLSGDWWRIFHSRQLNKLIAEGLANNQNLIAAKAALREANYTLRAETGGLLFPSIDLNASKVRNKTNGLAAGVGSASSSIFDVNNATFQVSYLLDMWGQSRREIESYAAQADYQRYEMLASYLSITTNIVTTSITIASLEAQIAATRTLITAQEKVLNITKKQRAVGAASDANVLSQETLLAQTQANLPPLQKTLSQEQHALAVLLGKPSSKTPSLKLTMNHLSLPKTLPVSLPSKLIEQRPDIQASQALLHSFNAQIGVATANLLPQVTMTANYGWLDSSTQNFFSASDAVWSIGAGLLQPVFHGGQLIMQRKAAIAAFDQAKAQYKQTVLQAFQNVADALRAIQFDASAFNASYRAEKTAKQSFQLTKAQYQVGGQNYLSVLQAEEQYQNAVLARVSAQAARYTDTAALYQALGGGWWNNSISRYGQPIMKNTHVASRKLPVKREQKKA